ncbi:hypothetical protein GPJ56_001184 [Histomonas meleagridis]|uniref:uncharacterized protein n=1 Tax=Histomonas meleagridis TaxID=135588 RepID=UPI00355A432D|nr:hypothetical protein GPJ56_001184 [Histomonas meleagridis]KAH0799853.1 hypothetical protein GO595_006965 [Histomonas meleagridis]
MNFYHKQCRELKAVLSFQKKEIKNAREHLLEKMKVTQEQRSLATLRSGFCLRANTQNIKDIIQLPFVKSEGFCVKSGASEVCDFGPDVDNFLKSIYKNFSSLPQLLSQAQDSLFLQNYPFLPSNVKPREFLASSTLPALFGHCWTTELRRAYIHFLMEVSKSSTSTFSNIREHWLFDCFKNFIFSSDIQQFLKVSIGDTILRVVRENTSNLTKLNSYVKEMVSNMLLNSNIFPKDVKLLIRSFADLANGSNQRLNRVEMLFIDCILAPAISLPKAYCILPPSYQLDMSPTGPARTLQQLAQHFRLILHPAQAKLRNMSENDIEALKAISFDKLLDELFGPINKDESNELNEPDTNEMLKLLSSNSLNMIFTMSDICLLASLVVAPELSIHQIRVPMNREFNYEFFRFKVDDLSIFNINVNNKNENDNRKDNSNVSSAANTLFRLLSHIIPNNNAPDEFLQFMKYYEKQTRLKHDFKTYTYLNHLFSKLSLLKDKEQYMLLDSFEEEIDNIRIIINENDYLLTQIERVCHELDNQIKSYKQKADQSYSVLYSALLNLFLQSDPSITQTIKAKRKHIMSDKTVFINFFQESIQKIQNFIQPIAKMTISGVIIHFHTWVMQMIPLKDFIEEHPQFVPFDNNLAVVNHELTKSVCIDPSADKLKRFFSNPSLFEFAEAELRDAEFVELPMEALKYISSMMDILRCMFNLEFNAIPQADEMTPLISFTLLSSKLTNMYSFSKYLEHFLMGLPQGDTQIVSETENVALTHFINHVESLKKIVAEA